MQMSIFQQHSLGVSAVVRMHRTPPIDGTDGRTLAACLQGSNTPNAGRLLHRKIIFCNLFYRIHYVNVVATD